MFLPPFTTHPLPNTTDVAIVDAEGFTVACRVTRSASELFCAAPKLLGGLLTCLDALDDANKMPSDETLIELHELAVTNYNLDGDKPAVSAIEAAAELMQAASPRIRHALRTLNKDELADLIKRFAE